ncbi:hypothetical protein P692DRAFT_20881946 [Suillus brevipes Sb2]|nr:hypothetical protein P692DRAFT_20881946 [Suillus brevipes Sb2]
MKSLVQCHVFKSPTLDFHPELPSLPSDLINHKFNQQASHSADNLDELDLAQWDINPPYHTPRPLDTPAEARWTQCLVQGQPEVQALKVSPLDTKVGHIWKGAEVLVKMFMELYTEQPPLLNERDIDMPEMSNDFSDLQVGILQSVKHCNHSLHEYGIGFSNNCENVQHAERKHEMIVLPDGAMMAHILFENGKLLLKDDVSVSSLTLISLSIKCSSPPPSLTRPPSEDCSPAATSPRTLIISPNHHDLKHIPVLSSLARCKLLWLASLLMSASDAKINAIEIACFYVHPATSMALPSLLLPLPGADWPLTPQSKQHPKV